MTNRMSRVVTVLGLSIVLGTGLAAAGSGMSTAYVVHGINGDDFNGLVESSLPVDVFVDGLGCAIPNLKFGEREGPLSVPAGSYDITISLADEAMPCDGTAVLALSGVNLDEGANGTIVAHRTADGMSGGDGDLLGLGVTASVFTNDFSYTGRGKARLIAHHTAFAPSVDVVISRDYEDPGAPSVTVADFSNPTSEADAVLSQVIAEFRPGQWDVALEFEGTTVFGPDALVLKPFTATYVYAVGDFGGGTFQYLVFTDQDLKKKGRRAVR